MEFFHNNKHSFRRLKHTLQIYNARMMKVLLKINKALEENEFFDTGWQAHRLYKTAGATSYGETQLRFLTPLNSTCVTLYF